jgi:SAM-dependent methyltransferase
VKASPQDIAALVKDVQETEHRYNLTGERSAATLPFMPYQPADFIGIVWECMPAIVNMKPIWLPSLLGLAHPPYKVYEVPEFLDVGCGPGTKMAIAEKLFGFRVHGIEIDAGMAFDAATRLAATDADIEQGDAMDFEGYDGFDLIWLYRPYRDEALERELEQRIIDAMKPGAVLAGGSWETDPAELGWEPIVDDSIYNQHGPGVIWRGAWRKPKVTAGG